MPVTAIINLRALSKGTVTRSFHCLMHPVVLDRISKADTAMGKILHDGGIMPPFSISPVMGARKRIVENESYWVRICILNDELENAFLETLEKGIWNEPIQLENHIFMAEDVVLGKQEGNHWSGRDSYEELLNKGNSQKISLVIASPMSFKRGDLHYPLPEASLIFGNLSRRWNLFSDHKLPENPDCTNVSYSYLNIKTEPFSLRKGGTILGVIGKLTLIFKNINNMKWYHALLRFAFYSGIGVKTTQGMGMSRIIEFPARD